MAHLEDNRDCFCFQTIHWNSYSKSGISCLLVSSDLLDILLCRRGPKGKILNIASAEVRIDEKNLSSTKISLNTSIFISIRQKRSGSEVSLRCFNSLSRTSSYFVSYFDSTMVWFFIVMLCSSFIILLTSYNRYNSWISYYLLIYCF